MAEAAREPLMREIRLTWWREQIEALFAGSGPAPSQPTLAALAGVIGRHALPLAPFEGIVDAHIAAIEGPPASASEVGAAALMRLAAQVLAPDAARSTAIAPAARAWALREAGDAPAVAAALREARGAGLSVAAFPAVAYATLARAYAKGREPSPLERRLRLTTAVLTGRL